ncbi:hypothetical protein Trydic_g19445 [Trypoxylus dichotomus]
MWRRIVDYYEYDKGIGSYAYVHVGRIFGGVRRDAEGMAVYSTFVRIVLEEMVQTIPQGTPAACEAERQIPEMLLYSKMTSFPLLNGPLVESLKFTQDVIMS